MKPRWFTRRCPVALAVTLAVLLAVLVPPRTSGIPVFDAANFTQNTLTALRTAEAILQRIEMIRHQIIQIEHMVTNLRTIENPTLREILSHLTRVLSEMERRTKGLIYSQAHLDDRFREVFAQGRPAEDLLAEDRRRIETSIETARAALLATRLQGEDLLRSQTTLARMKSDALSTRGNLQALQSVALLEAHGAEEISKLTQQMLIQTNLTAVALAELYSSRSEAEETFRKAVEASRMDVPAYASVPPLPVIPESYR
jgi:P-type conjugative transfer protein TrbJ